MALASTLLLGPNPAPAQTVPTRAELETLLPRVTGLERARILSRLVDSYKLDHPERSLDHGREALAILQEEPDPATEVATLNEMGWAHMTLSRYDSAVAYLERSRALAQRSGDPGGEARALSNLGTLNQRIGDPNRAVALFTQALAMQRELGADVEAATSLNNLGYVYSTDLADYGRSLGYHTQALSIRERLQDRAGVALSLNNIGIVYGRLGQYDRALEYFGRALAIRRELGQQTRIASTIHNIGDIHVDRGDPARALEYHREALRIRESLQDPSATAFSLTKIGNILLAMGDVDGARAELRKALEMGERVGDRGLNTRILLGLSEVERADDAPEVAARHARSALSLAEEMGSREMVRQATRELSKALEESGDAAGALATLRRSHVLADSIFTAETSRRVAELERLIRQEQQAAELERLRRDEAVARLAASQRALERNAVATVAVLVLICGLFLYRRRVEHARLSESASVTDPLTGAKNRRFLEQTLPLDVAASIRRHQSAADRGETPVEADLVFILLDIDDFKAVNDQLGHAAGDHVLNGVAAAIQRVVRDSEVVVRMGGDEFLVIMRFSDRAQGPVVAERLRREISNFEMPLGPGRTMRATCSIGFASFPFDPDRPDGYGWEDVLAIADLGTYSAKRDGRNRWVGFLRGTGPDLDPPRHWSLADVDSLVSEGRLVRLASRSPAVDTRTGASELSSAGERA